MSFDTVEQEKQYATALIEDIIKIREQLLVDILEETKRVKKSVRQAKKQLACDHDFKLKMVFNTDNYKCKKCKFEFEVGVQKYVPIKKNSVASDPTAYNDLYTLTDDDAPQVVRV